MRIGDNLRIKNFNCLKTNKLAEKDLKFDFGAFI